MLQNIYTVYDEKANAYLTPFFIPTDGMAIRAMEDALLDEKHQFTMHPGDYTLYRIAIFDDSNGSIIEKKQALTTLLELKSKNSNILHLDKK